MKNWNWIQKNGQTGLIVIFVFSSSFFSKGYGWKWLIDFSDFFPFIFELKVRNELIKQSFLKKKRQTAVFIFFFLFFSKEIWCTKNTLVNTIPDQIQNNSPDIFFVLF